MPSDVGKQTQEVDVIEHAVALESDCFAAFTEAAEQIQDGPCHDEFARLAAECQADAQAWQSQLRELNGTVAGPNRMSAWLNKFKVQVVAPFGRKAIAFAVTNNPADRMTAYERVASRADLRPVTRELASRMLKEAAAQREAVRSARR